MHHVRIYTTSHSENAVLEVHVCNTCAHKKTNALHCGPIRWLWLWQSGHQEQEGGTEKVPHAARTYAVSSIRFHPYLCK
jgi:hypothetical protein